jgi:hypothetical protein
MDLRSLKYFVSVYQERSFSAAAKACFVAQPSISFAIAQLEENLKHDSVQQTCSWCYTHYHWRTPFPFGAAAIGSGRRN